MRGYGYVRRESAVLVDVHRDHDAALGNVCLERRKLLRRQVGQHLIRIGRHGGPAPSARDWAAFAGKPAGGPFLAWLRDLPFAIEDHRSDRAKHTAQGPRCGVLVPKLDDGRWVVALSDQDARRLHQRRCSDA